MLNAGDLVGDYTVEREISVGRTGQADVYLAKHRDTGNRVAIKVLAQHLLSNEQAIKDFGEEAELLTKLSHDSIVRLESFDTSPPLPYIAEEYVEGQSVAQWLRQNTRPVPVQDVLHVAVQVADALAYAHGLSYFRIIDTDEGGRSSRKYRGMVHRDLSTDNILLTTDRRAKLIDFGIARAIGTVTVTATSTSLFGKEFYAAPEVEVGSVKNPSPAVDVYSFGVCLYEMVMTHRPESQRVRVLKQFHKNQHDLLAAFPNEIPEALQQIVAQCVQREPKDRPADMSAVRDALSELLEHARRLPAPEPTLPAGIDADSRILTFAREVALQKHELGGGVLNLTFNEDATRAFVLCDDGNRVCSFNLHGGEKRVRYVPRGKQLSAIAGTRGDEAIAISKERSELLLLKTSGDWQTLNASLTRVGPALLPDSLQALGESIYVGEYASNRILRLSKATGQVTAETQRGRITQLGPLAIGDRGVFFTDVATGAMFAADFDLTGVHQLSIEATCEWPTSLVVAGDLVFIVDSQRRCLSVVTAKGTLVEPSAVTWEKESTVPQIASYPGAGQLVMMVSSLPSLLYFDVAPVDCGLLVLAKSLGLPAHSLPEFTFEAIEGKVVEIVRSSPDSSTAARRFITTLQEASDAGRRGIQLQVSLHETLVDAARPKERPGLLREAIEKCKHSGDNDRTKRLCIRYLESVQGFDPTVRDTYGRMLEQEKDWGAIRDFEGPFLLQAFFQDPASRTAYADSFQRVKRAYANLGLPLPKDLDIRIPPLGELAKAVALLESKDYDRARPIFKQLVDSEDYLQMKPEDAITILNGYAVSIRRAYGVRSLSDWEEVCRTLDILVREYSHSAGFEPGYTRDLSAARRQIEKLKGAPPMA